MCFRSSLLALALACWAPSIAAQDASVSASEAFERGIAAYKRGDKAEAARWLARSDELRPSDKVLAAALDAARESSSAELGMQLVERAKSRETSANAKPLADRLEPQFRAAVGELRIECSAESCRVEGREPASRYWLAPGAYALSAECPPEPSVRREIEIAAGGELVVPLACPEAAPAPVSTSPPPAPHEPPVQGAAALPARDAAPAPESSGMSPAVFWIAAGATVLLAGLSIASYADTKAKHDRFEKGGATDADLADDGSRAEQRTYVLLALTAVGGAATAGLGLFFVDWQPMGDQRAIRVGAQGSF
jgi:hypothetical protein